MTETLTIKCDPAFSALANDLRYEAEQARKGISVDLDIRGIPPDMDYGSHHEGWLKTRASYRDEFTNACLTTADAAEAWGELGEPDATDVTASDVGLSVTIRDPQTSEPITVRRVLEDSPLNRARYASAEPISDLQWLAGTLYAADCAGEVPYHGNAAIIAGHGAYRTQADGVQRNLQVHMMTAPEPDDDDASEEDSDGNNNFVADPTAYVESTAWRFAKVRAGMTQSERRVARVWLTDGVESSGRERFVALLDKLVNLYATHDDHFAFDASRHQLNAGGHKSIRGHANDNARHGRVNRAATAKQRRQRLARMQ